MNQSAPVLSISFLYPTALFALLLLPPLLALAFVGRRGRGDARFWLGLGLRAAVLLGLVLGLAGMQVVQPVHEITTVFVVDHSDSVSAAEQQRAEDFIRAALAKMNAGDRAAVVVFGENALVERLASAETNLTSITSVPRTAHTNIASALRLALALFPDDTHKRIVLLSDGLENAGRATDVVELAAARGVQIDVVPLNAPAGQNEAYVDALEAPASVRKDQAFEIVAVVHSTTAGPGTVRLLGDGKLIGSREVTLQPGQNRISFSVKGDAAGFRRYEAELEAANDTLRQNNFGSAFTVVQGPARVLVVENSSGDADNLLSALESSHIAAERIAPRAIPTDLTSLSNYDAVFLVNVPAKALPDAAMNLLPSYVRDLGRGLVMIGGPDSYGAGGYLRTPLEKALPVDMDVRSKTQEPNVAMVFVIDKSGSMGACHCDDPNGTSDPSTRIASGIPKIDVAKDAILQAARGIGRADYVGVVVFDANALWALRIQQMDDPASIQQKIGGITAAGQTNIYAGLSEAEAALAQVSARFKHVILLTDGWSRSGDFNPLAQKMKAEGITLSIVGAGRGSATYLQQLADLGGGRFYAARDMSQVPQLFFKETVEAIGSYINEQLFQPLPTGTTPILRGLDVMRLPALRGYNGTTPKATAHVALVSDQNDPVLATWQYGLGRAVAWTSDTKGQWATEWVKWDQFNTFVAQLTNWVLPQPSDAGLQTSLSSDGEQTFLEVTSTDTTGRPRDLLDTRVSLVAPDLQSQTLTLTQVAPGHYRAPVTTSRTGTYLAQVTQQDANGTPLASATTGLVVPYSPEYKISDPAASILPELARATRGQVISDPTLAFAPVAQPATRTQPVWPLLLTLAALLFPLDVAARRLRITRADAQQFVAWAHLPFAQKQAAPAPRTLEGLFAARDRAARDRAARPARTEISVPPVTAAAPSSRIESPTQAPVQQHEPEAAPEIKPTAPPASSSEELTERLKQAKKRARR